jgi:predicted amidophosphoribosyltransferase
LNKEFSKKELPKKVVIIDDILTTGVTLENCALALKNAGVETVCAITVFIAD